jgi:hypothetical protein
VTADLESQLELGCRETGTDSDEVMLDVFEDKTHLLHYVGTGMVGTLSIFLCLDSAAPLIVKAYFYDT